MTRVDQVIRGWLGWCPDARALPQRIPVPENDALGSAPAQGAGMPAPAGWLNRYRNRVLIWAFFYTVAIIPIVPFFYGIDRISVCFGIITGLGIFFLAVRRLWNSFNSALTRGTAKKTAMEGYAILFMVVGFILADFALVVLASVSVIPFSLALTLPATAMGFAFIPWYVLILIILWERRTGYILIFDKKALSFSAARCS